MSDQPDLTERLAVAAADTVRKRRAAIEDGASNLRAVIVEVEPSNGGAVLDVTSYLSWKQTVRGGK